MTDIITTELALPDTGELIQLDDPNHVVYGLLQVRALKVQLDRLQKVFEEVLVEEKLRQGVPKLHLKKKRDVEFEREKKLEWDEQLLKDGLRAAGLPEERLQDLIVSTVSTKVNATVANQLARANPEYKKVVEAARTEPVGGVAGDDPVTGQSEEVSLVGEPRALPQACAAASSSLCPGQDRPFEMTTLDATAAAADSAVGTAGAHFCRHPELAYLERERDETLAYAVSLDARKRAVEKAGRLEREIERYRRSCPGEGCSCP